jgi:hypothetical protein
MESALDALKHHFATTTRKQREKAWEEIESLNLEGGIVKKYIEPNKIELLIEIDKYLEKK